MTKRWVPFDIGGVLETTDDDAWPGEITRRFAARAGLSEAEFWDA